MLRLHCKISAELHGIARSVCMLLVFNRHSVSNDVADIVDWLQSLNQFFTNVSYHIVVASLILMALF